MYSINKRLLENDTGRRLENLFWRILSSLHLQKTTSGTQIAFLFTLISQDNIIRTTPTTSPRSSRLYATSRRYVTAQQDVQGSERQGRNLEETSSGTRSLNSTVVVSAAHEGSGMSSPVGSFRPSSILKKSGATGSSQTKTARVMTPTSNALARVDVAHASISGVLQDTSSLLLDPVTQSVQSTSTGSLFAGIPRGAKKRTSFAVGSSKRRPTITRRKSSQSSSTKSASPNPVLQVNSQLAVTTESDQTTGNQTQELDIRGRGAAVPSNPSESPTKPTSRSASPVSDNPFRRPTQEYPFGSTGSINQPSTIPRDFAATLIPRQPTEVPGISRVLSKPTLTTSPSTSFQARGNLIPFPGPELSSNSTARRALGLGSSKALAGSAEVVAGNRNSELTRSKSQLTLLLKEDRRKGSTGSKGKEKDKSRPGGKGS